MSILLTKAVEDVDRTKKLLLEFPGLEEIAHIWCN